MSKEQKTNEIVLNEMERLLIMTELETIQKAQEAQQRYERIVSAIAQRCGYRGKVQLSQDVSTLILLEQPQEKPNANRQKDT